MQVGAAGIRLIAVDLDGTLLTSAGTIAGDAARLLRQVAEGGVHVVVSTTRTFHSAYPICQALGTRAPLICANGAQVYGTPDGPLWAQHALDREAALTIARLADAHQWELGMTVGAVTYLRQRAGQPLGQLRPNVMVVPTNAAALMNGEMDDGIDSPLRILTWQPEAAAAIRVLCDTQLSGRCYTEPYLKPDGSFESMGIFALQANKGTALRRVMDRLGISGAQVMTMGDNFNDLPMFACGRISVAMGNAPRAVQQQATHVAPGNDAEGVAWAIETLLGK
ncbi:MAG: HAD family phosphatase [Caldilineaceae bacterium]|nr:HAD family phosphatase [Caldilineaceae bacterium]